MGSVSNNDALRYLDELERSLNSTREAKQLDLKTLIDGASSDEEKLALVDAVDERYGIAPIGTDPDLAESARADIATITDRRDRRRERDHEASFAALDEISPYRGWTDTPKTPRVRSTRSARSAPRPRGRRQRHVSRSTSSSDSGDDGPGEPEPPLGARSSRDFLRGLGRGLRNRWKRGWRP